MDALTLIGLLTGFLAIIVGQMFEGGDFHSLLNLTSFMIVLGGTLGAVMVQTPMSTFKRAFSIMPWIFMPPHLAFDGCRNKLIDLAKRARQLGLLSLEEQLDYETNHLIHKGLELLVIGVDKTTIRQVLEAEIDRLEFQDLKAAHVFESMGGYSPTIGIMGAVLGLIQVMRNLADPSQLGMGIAVAFVATIYGVGLANLIFLPIANKLKSLIARQAHFDQMIVEGFVGMASGESPNILLLKLSNFGKQPKKNENKKKENEEHVDNHRWVVSYADFITLLFAFFVVMYAISSLNDAKYKSMSEGMHSAFNNTEKGKSKTSSDGKADGIKKSSTKGKFDDGMEDLNKSLSEFKDENYQLQRQDGWIEMNIQAGALFEAGNAALKPDALLKLMKVAEKIRDLPYPVAIEGYTDDVPIATPEYPSNWELSAARAAVVGRVLNNYGIDTNRITVTGYADQFPIVDNITDEGRRQNRRVNILITKNKRVKRLFNPQYGLNGFGIINPDQTNQSTKNDKKDLP